MVNVGQNEACGSSKSWHQVDAFHSCKFARRWFCIAKSLMMWPNVEQVARGFFWLLSGKEYFEKGHRFSSSLKLFWSTIFSGFCSKRTSPQQQLDAWIHLPNTKETGHVCAHVGKHSRKKSPKKSGPLHYRMSVDDKPMAWHNFKWT